MTQKSFFIKRNEDNILKLQSIKKELPFFCSEFFMGIESNSTPLTRIGYALDLKTFFNFLVSEMPDFMGKEIRSLSYSDLDRITSTHLEYYLHFLTLYKVDGKVYRNGDKSKSRKLSSVRSLLKYFFKKGAISKNVGSKIDTPKIHENEIIRLEIDEMVKILNESESGENLTKMQRGFHIHTKKRDLAMLSLFLGTGIRISECVGLNLEDIDFENNAFNVTRKGGNRVILYFNDEVKETLLKYVDERINDPEVPKEENALFLSLQKKRIGVRAVEKLVKKYAQIAAPLKKITPHKLRSTFGTNLYRETGDIYVVATVLGHRDVNTTRKHYAAISEDIRRTAANKVKLRKEE